MIDRGNIASVVSEYGEVVHSPFCALKKINQYGVNFWLLHKYMDFLSLVIHVTYFLTDIWIEKKMSLPYLIRTRSSGWVFL